MSTPPAANPSAAAIAALPAQLRDAMLADAGRRAGGAEPRVLDARAVTWPDGALGCPEPGMAYTQALVPGWWVRIEAGTGLFDYHASRRGGWKLCPAGRGSVPASDSRAY